ncbi:hypothetical protein OC834_002452 [Tilletia horrida]|uniref:GOLD domain-containing protein n=1 Tax=Tilletia horrida TaxID=155126 RepID=A0AAN6GGW4_9BASI|nr:hypothetical protein OC835_004413 [Tilletia horrida]KAK0532883.1 hypothetical protein OC834_002452 [Tilletia horrida]KAK0540493.1 hypothetical protein OC842_000428 [Tilletia horrida]KAK0546887.1 hypothetical protein OC844_007213 [Tilletia horrida]
MPRSTAQQRPAAAARNTRLAALLLLAASLLCALTSLPTRASAAALTTIVQPHEKVCYHAWVDKEGEKVGFYFAVQSASPEVDYYIEGPHGKHILGGIRERQLDIIFTGNDVGEYSFCFENDQTYFQEKMIDFDITVESEPRLELPISKAKELAEHSAPLQEGIMNIDAKLNSIHRTQRYFHTRENRNYNTVVSTQSRIFWYSVIESLVIIAISVAQVYVVRHLFEKGSTKRYRV